MPRITTSLTVKQIKSPAKKSATNSKPDRIADGKGLWIYKYPSKKRTWYARYTVKGTGTQKSLLIGDFPDISLADARLKNSEIKKIAKSGIDPKIHYAEEDIVAGSKITFATLAEDWLESRKLTNKKDKEHIRRLKANILPVIGNIPFQDLKKGYLKDNVINVIEERKKYAEAKRNVTTLKLVFKYGINKYDLEISNPAENLESTEYKSGHFKALTNEPDVRQLVKDIWSYRDNHPRRSIHVHYYLKLAIMLFIRPSELREMTWDDYDHSSSTLTYTISKTDTKHTIILPTQARLVFESLIKDKRSTYIFPTHNTGKVQPISDNTPRSALNTMGYAGRQTIHGFRATARTLLDERLNQDIRYIENQLGHVPKDTNGKAYNRTQYVEQRKDLLQLWTDYLDALRKDEDIKEFIKVNVK